MRGGRGCGGIGSSSENFDMWLHCRGATPPSRGTVAVSQNRWIVASIYIRHRVGFDWKASATRRNRKGNMENSKRTVTLIDSFVRVTESVSTKKGMYSIKNWRMNASNGSATYLYHIEVEFKAWAMRNPGEWSIWTPWSLLLVLLFWWFETYIAESLTERRPPISTGLLASKWTHCRSSTPPRPTNN